MGVHACGCDQVGAPPKKRLRKDLSGAEPGRDRGNETRPQHPLRVIAPATLAAILTHALRGVRLAYAGPAPPV